MDSYSSIAPFYDIWQESCDGPKKADYAENIIKKYCAIEKGDGEEDKLLLLDLGCGTGDFAIEMTDRGYDVIAADICAEMLCIARGKKGSDKIRFIRQDITEFELFGTVDVITCLTDTINHILTEEKLGDMFRLCKNYLNPGGVFLFDALTPFYFKEKLSGNTFFDIRDGFAAIWENSYNENKRLNTAKITVFSEETKSGLYSRKEQTVRERAYNPETFEKLAQKYMLPVKTRYGDFTLEEPDERTERIFFVVMNG